MNTKIDSIDYDKNYYTKNNDNIIKQFNSLIKAAKKDVLPIYGDLDVDLIEKQSRIELESILSRLPYVGGDKAPFTPLMIQSALTITLYKVIKPLNLSERDIGKLIYEIAESHAQSISSIKKRLYRKHRKFRC